MTAPATSDGPSGGIASYHAHIYYDPATTRGAAERVREGIAGRFLVQLGRWHDKPVGPHGQAMYQVAFDTGVFASLIPWLMLNREGLTVFVHPNTGAPRADHATHALWMGEILPLKTDMLPERETEAEPPVVPNTAPLR